MANLSTEELGTLSQALEKQNTHDIREYRALMERIDANNRAMSVLNDKQAQLGNLACRYEARIVENYSDET